MVQCKVRSLSRVGPYWFCSDGNPMALLILLWSFFILSHTQILIWKLFLKYYMHTILFNQFLGWRRFLVGSSTPAKLPTACRTTCIACRTTCITGILRTRVGTIFAARKQGHARRSEQGNQGVEGYQVIPSPSGTVWISAEDTIIFDEGVAKASQTSRWQERTLSSHHTPASNLTALWYRILLQPGRQLFVHAAVSLKRGLTNNSSHLLTMMVRFWC